MTFDCSDEDKEIFWKNVTKTYHKDGTDSCWLWRGKYNTFGYGHFFNSTGEKFVHRFSFVLHGGFIPAKYDVNHICEIRSCVNPSHLEAITHKENCLKKEYGQNFEMTSILPSPLSPIERCVRILEEAFVSVNVGIAPDWTVKDMINYRLSSSRINIWHISLDGEEIIFGKYKRKYFELLDDLLMERGFICQDILDYYKDKESLISIQ